MLRFGPATAATYGVTHAWEHGTIDEAREQLGPALGLGDADGSKRVGS